MPRTLTSHQILSKNLLYEGDPWLLLVEFTITTSWRLYYDGQTANFHLGQILIGQQSGARARIVADVDNGTYGTLYLYDPWGAFKDGEPIKDNDPVSPGAAGADGTLFSPAATSYRFAANPDDVSWDGATWKKAAMLMDVVEQSGDGTPTGANLKFQYTQFNTADSFEWQLYKCYGFRGTPVTCYHICTGQLSDDAMITEEWVISEAAWDGEWVQFVLVPPEMGASTFPNRVYDNAGCLYQFKDTNTCQYLGSDLTCDGKLSTCMLKDNVINFGAFPAIPGEEFE